MSGLYFIFTLVASYSLGVSGLVSIECMEKAEENCDRSVFPDEFPKTVDQLRDACSGIKELQDCMLKSFETCTDNPSDAEGTEDFRRIVHNVHDFCREDSEIYNVISSNLDCIASNGKEIYGSCRALSFSEPTKELITNMFQYANKSQEESYNSDVWCIENLWDDYCPSIKVGILCGSDVGTAVRDILTQLEDRDICYEEFVAEVTPMLEQIELAIVEEEKSKKDQEEK